VRRIVENVSEITIKSKIIVLIKDFSLIKEDQERLYHSLLMNKKLKLIDIDVLNYKGIYFS
jgi:hypothetical protein